MQPLCRMPISTFTHATPIFTCFGANARKKPFKSTWFQPSSMKYSFIFNGCHSVHRKWNFLRKKQLNCYICDRKRWNCRFSSFYSSFIIKIHFKDKGIERKLVKQLRGKSQLTNHKYGNRKSRRNKKQLKMHTRGVYITYSTSVLNNVFF